MSGSKTKLRHLLLLAGSGEAHDLASELAGRPDWRVSASLVLEPRVAGPLAVPTRQGGFGGDAGFAQFLAEEAVDAVLDATHPFAARISARTHRICAEQGVPHVQLLRPAWRAGPGDDWCEVADEAAANAMICPGQNVFTTTGRATLDGFAGFPGAQLFVRRLRDTGDAPKLKNVTYVIDQGPFSVDHEIQVFKDLGINVLIAKNSGGASSRTKLDAARAMGLPVILIRRSPPSGAAQVQTVAQALDWIDRL